MPNLRTAIGWRLRNLAERIDPAHTMRGGSMTFTFEANEGTVLRQDRRGCPLWYRTRDYERAYTEADTEWRPRGFDAEAEIQRLAESLRVQGPADD